MGKWKLDKSNMDKFIKKLDGRMDYVLRETARESMRYLTVFGYHADGGGAMDNANPGWSFYYAANWNAGVNEPDLSVITPERGNWEPHGAYSPELEAKRVSLPGSFSEATAEDALYVTNSVDYGEKLNSGDESWGIKPNRFIEQCETHVTVTVPGIIKRAIREVN